MHHIDVAKLLFPFSLVRDYIAKYHLVMCVSVENPI